MKKPNQIFVVYFFELLFPDKRFPFCIKFLKINHFPGAFSSSEPAHPVVVLKKPLIRILGVSFVINIQSFRIDNINVIRIHKQKKHPFGVL